MLKDLRRLNIFSEMSNVIEIISIAKQGINESRILILQILRQGEKVELKYVM